MTDITLKADTKDPEATVQNQIYHIPIPMSDLIRTLVDSSEVEKTDALFKLLEEFYHIKYLKSI